MALQFLPFRFRCWRRFPVIAPGDGPWRRSRRGGRGLRRSQSSGGSRRLLANRGLSRRQRRRLRILYRELLAGLDFEFFDIVRAD